MKEDGIFVRGTDFTYSIPKMIIDSITHAKDHFRDDLPVFITKLIRPLDEKIRLIGDPEVIKEKPMSLTMSGVKRLWTNDFAYKKAVDEAIRGYPLEADPIKGYAFFTTVEAYTYHNASFEITKDFLQG